MNYFISRGDQQYGPYTLADLQRYVQQGNIALTDKARSEGMTDWVPVSQVIGNVNIVQPGPPGAPATPYGNTNPAGGFGGAPAGSYGAPATPYSAPGYVPQNLPVGTVNPPPSLHWALVLLFTIFSCGIFGWVWAIIQAVWVRKIRPGNSALFQYIASVSLNYCGYFALLFITLTNHEFHTMEPFFRLVLLIVVWGIRISGNFTIKAALEDYYNSEEPIGLQLSGVMTFFFGMLYFQYHFTRIREMKDMQMSQQGGAQYPAQYYGR